MKLTRYLPLVDKLRIDLKRPYETAKHFDRPRVIEDIFHIRHVHAKLVTKSLFNIEGGLAQNAMNL